jgi:hypothetical protein
MMAGTPSLSMVGLRRIVRDFQTYGNCGSIRMSPQMQIYLVDGPGLSAKRREYLLFRVIWDHQKDINNFN